MKNIGFKESLTVEFKSDKKQLPDSDIIEVITAFANTEGGSFYLGVEDDGTITGLHSSHYNDIDRLTAFIANKTVPPVAVRVEKLEADKIPILKITVPKYKSIVATSSGRLLRRRIKMDGTPENIPMYPYEISSRLSDLSLLDFSAQPVPDATIQDFDLLEIERLRTVIRDYHGEVGLLELSNDELCKALRLTTVIGNQTYPTLTGILMLGKRERLRELVPTAEAAIQVMEGTTLKVNESFMLPILASIDKITKYFDAWNSEEELEYGLFRISIPHYDKRAFREALINAFSHRDYSVLGRVRVVIANEGLTISNPGGFIEGITYQNLIDAEPRGRNPALADCLKRIGLAERSGRGIDRIYEGTLRYGKGVPDYSSSNSVMVKLFVPNCMPDKAFITMLTENQTRTHNSLSVYALIILNYLKNHPRTRFEELQRFLGLERDKLKISIESLVEDGLVEAIGHGRARSYLLSARMYKKEHKLSGYVRQTDIDEIRYTELTMKLLQQQKEISRKDVVELLHVTPSQAYRILQKLRVQGKIVLKKRGRNATYEKAK